MATKKKDALVKNSSKDVEMFEYDPEDCGAGFENQTQADYSIPFITILQALSPQVKEFKKQGAEQGQIINTVTNDRTDGEKGILFIPCTTDHKFVEWVPRKKGGGFVGTHEIDSTVVEEAKLEMTEWGKYKVGDNDLTETFFVFGLVVNEDDGSTLQAVITFKSAMIKKYKKWMTKARSVTIKLPSGGTINPPLFAHVYRLTTMEDQNKAGEAFYNWSIAFNGEQAKECRLGKDDDNYISAKGYRDMIIQGALKPKYDSNKDSESGEKSEEPDF